MERVLVLGGTGHIGAAVAREFADAGYDVTATGRRPGQRENLAGTNVAVSAGDDLTPGVLEHWVQRHTPDIVVDAATPYPVWLTDARNGDPTGQAVARVRRVLNACKRAQARLVLVSSFVTLPRQSVTASDEVLRALHCYFHLKSSVEGEVLAAFDRGDLTGSVVNPAACLGPYDLKPQALALVPSLLAGKVRAVTNAQTNVVDVRDVASCVRRLAESDQPPRQVPIFGHTLSVAELARQICAGAGVVAPRVTSNAMLGLAGLYGVENVLALAGRRTPWPSLSVMLLLASQPRSPSPEQLAHGDGVRPLDATLRDSIHWYRQIVGG